MIASLCGLIYQVLIIYDQYKSGKTIISIKIGRPSFVSPPAVTICFDGLLSMERAAKFHPGFSIIGQIYENLTKNDKTVEIFELYKSSFRNYTDENLNKNGLDIEELFDKLSIKYHAIDGNETILLALFGNTKVKTQPGQFQIKLENDYNLYKYTAETLETMLSSKFTIN